MKKIAIALCLFLLFAKPCHAEYIYVWLTDNTGLTIDKDKDVAKRGEVVSVTDDSAPPSEREKQNFLIVHVRNMSATEKEELLENWGDSIEDRANYKGKRRLFDMDTLINRLGLSNGLIPGTFNYNVIKNRLRLKTDQDIAKYNGLVYRRYAGRQFERFINWIDPTRPAYAETITTICPTSCDYTTGDNWETAEGGGGTLSEVKSGNIKDDDGSFNCDSITIGGQTTSSTNYMHLYSAVGERHNGSETTGASGTGSLITTNSGGVCVAANDQYTVVEWLQINGNGVTHNQLLSTGVTSGGKVTWSNIIMRDAAIDRAVMRNFNGQAIFHNILAYDITGGAGDGCLEGEQASCDVEAYNVTLVNCGEIGFERNNAGCVLDVFNSVSCGAGTTDFESDITTVDQNVSCDATACDSGGTPSTDCIESQTAANLFEDPTGHDYTPKLGSALIDFGNDYATTPTGVNVDLKGRDRDAQGDTWDVGAIEYVSGAAPAYKPRVIMF